MSGSGESASEVRLSLSPPGPTYSDRTRSELVPIRVNLRLGERRPEPRTGLIPREYLEMLRRLLTDAEASMGVPCRLEGRVRSEEETGGRITLAVTARPASSTSQRGRGSVAGLEELVGEAASLRKLPEHVEARDSERERSEKEHTPA